MHRLHLDSPCTFLRHCQVIFRSRPCMLYVTSTLCFRCRLPKDI